MLYSSDFYGWTQAQAKFLKTRQWDELDIANLVEEVEALGRQERQELQRVCSNSWRATIREQRRRIMQLLKDSPSLKPFLEEVISRGYDDGLDLAVRETNLPYDEFPNHCPFTAEDIFDSNL